MATKVLVIGRTGQLAQALARRPAPADMSVRFVGREALDLSDSAAADALVRAERPDLLLLAAAYTAVDRAEAEESSAMRVNGDAPTALARVCEATGAAMVHISTDYVFDGAASRPYVETDPTAPINAYGRTKLAGEAGVLESGAAAAVLRTSWVYGPTGANFAATMLRLAVTRPEVSVVADQIGRPTAAADLAEAMLQVGLRLVEGDARARGLFHYAGGGDASWADFGEAVFAASVVRGGPGARVRRITTAEYSTPARRPANSRLDTGKIEALGVPVRPWREAVAACVAAMPG